MHINLLSALPFQFIALMLTTVEILFAGSAIFIFYPNPWLVFGALFYLFVLVAVIVGYVKRDPNFYVPALMLNASPFFIGAKIENDFV
jgi:hypothetical protein